MELTLLFKLGDKTYGLEIDAIQEIVESPDQHFVPLSAGVLKGAINFHGQILALIDLPTLLDFAGGEPDHRCVILTPEHRSLALQISGIERIVKIDLDNLSPPPVESNSSATRGVIDFEGSMINMLDTEDVIQKLETLYRG